MLELPPDGRKRGRRWELDRSPLLFDNPSVHANLTLLQRTNLDGFPKPGELIEITGAHELEASDRAILNLLYQHAHDSGRLGDRDAEWEIPMTALRASRHKGSERIRDSLDRLMGVVVTVPLPDRKTGEPRILKTHLFDFFDLST